MKVKKYIVTISILTSILVLVFIILKTTKVLSPVPERDKSTLSYVISLEHDLKDEGTEIGSKGLPIEIMTNDQKLRSFTKAFIGVRSYLDKAGRNANYLDTTKIVEGHGLSVGEYTQIATFMNEYPSFRQKILTLIDEFRDGSQ